MFSQQGLEKLNGMSFQQSSDIQALKQILDLEWNN